MRNSGSRALTVSPTLASTSLTTPATCVPTAMFSVAASISPDPATYDGNGASAGSATGLLTGTALFPARTV